MILSLHGRRRWVRKYQMNYGKRHSKGYTLLLFALDIVSFSIKLFIGLIGPKRGEIKFIRT